jgi:hypothetical protein
VLLAGSAAPAAAAAAAGSASRASSSAAGSLRDRSSPVMTPRRTAGSYAGAVNSNVCSTTGAANSSCTRPGSSSSSGRDPGGSFVSSTTRRTITPGYVSNKQQSANPYVTNTAASSRPYSASKQGSRPGSSAGRPSSQQHQQQQQQQQQQQWRSCSRSQALPAGVLSQDPAPAAVRPGAVNLQNNNSSSSSSSMTQSRPGSAARQPAAAATELRCSSRQQQQQPYRPRQQSAVGTTAASTPSVLAATPRNRPASTTSSHRPGSAAATARNSRQQQQHGEAQGPLLSEYFRPPSAAAPGSISMFGLPGMEPPGGLAGAAPSVRVPSVHASWDAGVGGLLSVSSSSSCALGSPKAGSASAAGMAAATAAALCSQLNCRDAGNLQQQQQQRKKAQARPGTTPTSTWADHDETPGGRGSAQTAARPDSSRCVRRPGSAAVGRDTSEAPGVQQLLLWSAAHEIDGRPVTRNGERAR